MKDGAKRMASAMDTRTVVAVMSLGGAFDLMVDLVEAAGTDYRLLIVNGGEQRWEPHEVAALDGLVEYFDAAGLDAAATRAGLAARGVAGVVAFRDELLVRTAGIAEGLGLPYHSPETARRLTDKYLQRQALACAGLPQPRFAAFTDPAGAPAAARAVGFPAVLKPLAGSGSRNVFTVADPAGLDTALETAHGAESGWLLEERMQGTRHPGADWLADYVSVETLALGDDQYWHLGVTDRLPMYPPLLEGGACTPSLLPEPVRAQVCEVTRHALAALGVQTGVSHTEIKLTPDGPRIIEVNGRIGGLLPQLTRTANGLDLVRLALDSATGRADRHPVTDGDISFAFFTQMPPGSRRVAALADADTAGTIDGVWRVDVHHTVGAPVDARAGLLGRVQTVFATAPDADGLLTSYRRLRAWADRGNVFENDLAAAAAHRG